MINVISANARNYRTVILCDTDFISLMSVLNADEDTHPQLHYLFQQLNFSDQERFRQQLLIMATSVGQSLPKWCAYAKKD